MIKQVFCHLGFAALMIVLTLALQWGCIKAGGSFAKDWLLSAVSESNYTELPNTPIANPSPPRLQEQYDSVHKHSIMQLRVYRDIEQQYYSWTMTWLVLMAVSAVLGLFAGKDGWGNANPYLLNATITVVLLTSLYTAIPKVLSAQANTNSAKKSYEACQLLGNEIRSFAAQVHVVPAGKTVADLESEFMNNVDKRFAEIRNLNFDIDPSQAPDYRKAIQDQMKTK
jgi:hypothetical protein